MQSCAIPYTPNIMGKTSITCSLAGGLGNQLFQIFTTIAYALDNNCEFVFDNIGQLNKGTPRPTYWNSFFYHLKPHIKYLKIPSNAIIINEQKFNHTALPSIPVPKNNDAERFVILKGYFQSYKYFKRHDKFLLNCIYIPELKSHLSSLSRTIINSPDRPNYDNTISMHFRIGDYKQLQHKHPLLPTSYYINALKYILHLYPSLTHVLYFCETCDIMDVNRHILQLQAEFPNLIFQQPLIEFKDWEQLILMSLCAHNIIANSTFSWWGAYFNTNTHPHLTCYPSKWFGPAANNLNTKDLFPDDWVSINNE